jgi:hypothetical protein
MQLLSRQRMYLRGREHLDAPPPHEHSMKESAARIAANIAEKIAAKIEVPAMTARKRSALATVCVLLSITPALHAQSQTQLPPDEVIRRMVHSNQQRADSLRAFQGTRTYHLTYQGFPVNREAEMVTTITYHAPGSKQFTEVSQTGSKLIVDRVFRKLLESEQDALKDENRARTALNPDNYTFTLIAYEPTPQPNYVFQVEPKNASKYLYRGKVWIDAHDFAVSRMEVEPAKSPSFWTKKSQISHVYTKVDGFWLPKQNRSISTIRLGGQATLTIDYSNYKILDPPSTKPETRVSRLVTPLN